MILKGNKRGGAIDLGHHLLKAENEHVEVHEIRGFMADNVIGALREAQAVARGTKCGKFLFSLALSPPKAESVPLRAFTDAIECIEEKLGLSGQPRVVIFHEKEGRRHAHCVWSRINAETMTAIDQPHFKLKLQDISRKLYLEHGWKMPDGLIDPALRNPLNFDRHEWFKAKRTGQDPRTIKAVFQQCWAASDAGKALREALHSRGYYLARGDRRAVVAVDVHGEVYAVARWADVKTKDVVSRMGDIESLPSIAETQKHVSASVQAKLSGFLDSAAADFARAAQPLEAERLELVERHRAARRDLRLAHEARQIEEAKVRTGRLRKGILGLWDRVTGQHGKLLRRSEQEVLAAESRDAGERQALVDRQLQERQCLQREIDHMRKAQLREITRLHRQLAEHQRLESGVGERNAMHQTSEAELRRKRIRREWSGPQ